MIVHHLCLLHIDSYDLSQIQKLPEQLNRLMHEHELIHTLVDKQQMDLSVGYQHLCNLHTVQMLNYILQTPYHLSVVHYL